MTREDFMENTLDVWEIPPESATRVGHPAPFPVELPSRLIELYTFEGDLVLDPFLGAGTTAVAATRLNRHYLGYDLDEHYLALASERIAREHARRGAIVATDTRGESAIALDEVDAMIEDGHSATDVARALLVQAQFTIVSEQVSLAAGFRVTFKVEDPSGAPAYVDVAGAYTHARAGLNRSEVLWHAIARASVMNGLGLAPLIVLSTGVPEERSPQARALRACVGENRPIAAVFDILDPASREHLRSWHTRHR